MNLETLLKNLGMQLQITEYAVDGKNPIIFAKKDDILKTELFKRFSNTIDYLDNSKIDPQVTILGKAAASIFEGLMHEISEDQWRTLNENPDTRMILQQTLVRIMTHLDTAEKNIDDFSKFSQSIELLQSEIATILSLTQPFKHEDFQNIYKSRLNIVSDDMKENVKAGVSKSAMNTFAGINSAVLQMSPKLTRAHGEGVYFEQVSFMGDNKTINEILKDNQFKSVDLYLGEFNHNINPDLDVSHYEVGNVVKDIRDILAYKNGLDKKLTVAIDATIDFVNSPKAKELLEEFALEIEAGQLNFVFFRSGQKFEMFGMDNYYGCPFWMVNNGSKEWDSFNQLFESDAHKTDSLSVQWFCLANKYAPQALDDYRGQIFKNAKDIINAVPADLKEGGALANRVRVSTVSSDMEPSFIDIKVIDSNSGISRHMKNRLAKRFADAGVKMHQRSSFGFANANINIIPAHKDDGAPRNVRINPGLNPEENKIILDFIKEDIPDILNKLDAQKK